MGLLRQVLVARQFGLTYDIDVFNAANNIPDLLSALISGGALGVALIPVLSEYMEKQGRREAWHLFSQILNLAFLVTGLLSLIIIIFARPMVEFVIAPGFPEPQKQLTVELMRLDLAAILLFSISGLIMAGLQANQHFLLPAMAPVFYNLGQIFGVWILAPQHGHQIGGFTFPAFGMGIHGLVYGVIIGAIMHLCIQIPGLIKYQFHWVPIIDLQSPGVKKVLYLMGPRVLTMLFIQTYFVARDNLASRLEEGSVSALNYGWFIMQVPETLIGTAIAIVLLPTLSEYMARGEMDHFKETLNKALRVLIALSVPVSVLLAMGVKPLVGVLGFDPSGTDRVVLATQAYLLGLLGHSLLEIASRSFYAQQNARVPLYAAAIMVVVFLGCAIFYTSVIGFVGIALANVTAFTLEALLLLYLLNRKLPSVIRVWDMLPRVILASLLGGLFVFAVLNWVPFYPDRRITAAVYGLGVLTAGGAIVLPFIWKELRILVRLGK